MIERHSILKPVLAQCVYEEIQTFLQKHLIHVLRKSTKHKKAYLKVTKKKFSTQQIWKPHSRLLFGLKIEGVHFTKSNLEKIKNKNQEK